MLFYLFLFGLLGSSQVSARLNFKESLTDLNRSINDQEIEVQKLDSNLKNKLGDVQNGLNEIINSVKDLGPDNQIIPILKGDASKILDKIEATAGIFEIKILPKTRKEISDILGNVKDKGIDLVNEIVKKQRLAAEDLVKDLKNSIGSVKDVVEAKKRLAAKLGKILDDSVYSIRQMIDDGKLKAKQIKADLEYKIFQLGNEVHQKKDEIESDIAEWKNKAFKAIDNKLAKGKEISEEAKEKIKKKKLEIEDSLNNLRLNAKGYIDNKITLGVKQGKKLMDTISIFADDVDDQISKKIGDITSALQGARVDAEHIMNNQVGLLKDAAHRVTRHVRNLGNSLFP